MKQQIPSELKLCKDDYCLVEAIKNCDVNYNRSVSSMKCKERWYGQFQFVTELDAFYCIWINILGEYVYFPTNAVHIKAVKSNAKR